MSRAISFVLVTAATTAILLSGCSAPDGATATMVEEHLFRDNQTYANQIGIGQ